MLTVYGQLGFNLESEEQLHGVLTGGHIKLGRYVDQSANDYRKVRGRNNVACQFAFRGGILWRRAEQDIEFLETGRLQRAEDR